MKSCCFNKPLPFNKTNDGMMKGANPKLFNKQLLDFERISMVPFFTILLTEPPSNHRYRFIYLPIRFAVLRLLVPLGTAPIR